MREATLFFKLVRKTSAKNIGIKFIVSDVTVILCVTFQISPAITNFF